VEARVYFAENRMVYQELPFSRGLAYSGESFAVEIFLWARDEGCTGCDREVFPG
jgi:hypothetical protein